MNIKTTLALLVIAASLLAIWVTYFQGGPGEVTPWTGRPFFDAFVPTDAAELIIDDPTGERIEHAIRLERSGSNWQLTSKSVEDGHPVAARTRVANDVLDAMQAIVPLRVVNGEPTGQDEIDLGLDARSRLTIAVKGPTMAPISLQFGANVGAGEVTCRASSRPEIFAVPREVIRRLAPRPKDAVDPALLRLNVLDVRRLTLARSGDRVLDVERGHQRWFMNTPFESAPADAQRCDQLRAAILSLSIVKHLWDDNVDTALPDPAPWTLTVRTATGSEHAIDLDASRSEGLITARRRGAAHAVKVSDDILALLDGDWGRFRDRHPIQAPASRLLSIGLAPKDGTKVVFRRFNQVTFRIDLPGRQPRDVPLLTDDVDMSSFLSAIRGIELQSFGSEERLFEPAIAVTITVHDPGATEPSIQTIEIGPEQEGRRPLRIVGQPGSGTIAADAASPLLRPYWHLIERRARCTDGYFKLGKVEIRDNKGNVALYEGRIPAPKADLVLARDRSGNLTDIPEDLKKRLVHQMIEGLSVDNWVGETKTEKMGFEEPQLLVRWFEPKGASTDRLPKVPEGKWRALVIGARRPDGLHFATIDDGTLDLVFLVDPKDLAPFTDMLK